MAYPQNIKDLSPMMRQYMAVKSRHMDEILFYRLGDFYEMFFDDARLVSRELELTLTGRDCGLPERAPMCGVPHHASETYIGRLVKKGYKVAICEQTEDPALAKGIVRREIIRVVTPGTVTESSMLSEESNNYIASVFMGDRGFGLCFADISTGVARVTESAAVEGAIGELARFEPSELVCNTAAFQCKPLIGYLIKTLGIKAERLYDGSFEPESAKARLLERFSGEQCVRLTALPDGLGLAALGGLLKYLTDTQFEGVRRLVELDVYRCEQFLSIAHQCRRNLELTSTIRANERRGSLLWVLDSTTNAMGRRMLRSFIDKPLIDSKSINRRLEAVDELVHDSVQLTRLTGVGRKIADIERLMTRVLYRSATPRDLNAIAYTSHRLCELRQLSSGFVSPLLKELAVQLDCLEDAAADIEKTVAEQPPALMKDGGYIRSGFSAEIDELREMVKGSKNYLARMQQQLRDKTGIKTLKVGYNRVFGYYIETPRSAADAVPAGFIRKQTLANGERYITEELKELENKILGAGERLNLLERELFEQLRASLEGRLDRFQKTALAVAQLDVLCSFASTALENNYCRPEVDDSDIIDIKGGRHPVVEQMMNGGLFVPNDTLLDCGGRMLSIITGPNMAGKSTYMRQTALIVLMAQMGSFVPAKSARIGVVDAIFTRVGSSDDISSGDSTFMVEMKEVAHILKNATSRSLLILDEIGRGTSTYDGMSIARAVIEYITREGGLAAKTMFATHYHELTELADRCERIKNYNIAVKKRGEDILFLRKIVPGPTDDSYGIEVARLAGLPDEAIELARRALEGLESRSQQPARRRAAPRADEADSARAAALLAQLREISVETMTPIEAMYTLNDLAKTAQEKEG